MLTNPELRELSQLSWKRTLLALGYDWLGIISIFLSVIWLPHPITFLLGFILMGKFQLNLAIMMHDAAHKRMFQNGMLNDWVSQIFTAAPLFFSMPSYRVLHLKHHKDPLAADDPDLSLIGGYPVAPRSLARKLLRDLFGVSYFKFIRYFIYMARRPQSDPSLRTPMQHKPHTALEPVQPKIERKKSTKFFTLSSIVVVNVIFFFVLWSMHYGHLYFFFWVLPAVTILQVLLRIRGIAEHGGYTQNSDQRVNARTVVNPWQTFFFAPHNVGYHIEHHVYPSIPFFNLPRVHQLMKERNSLPEQNLYQGYGPILKELTNQR